MPRIQTRAILATSLLALPQYGVGFETEFDQLSARSEANGMKGEQWLVCRHRD